MLRRSIRSPSRRTPDAITDLRECSYFMLVTIDKERRIRVRDASVTGDAIMRDLADAWHALAGRVNEEIQEWHDEQADAPAG